MIIDAPINNLSLGNVSLNIIRELIEREHEISGIFPVGENADFSAYDKLEDDIRTSIIDLAMGRLRNLNKKDPSLRIWHINGSEKKVSDKQFLFSFYETDEPTLEEIRILEAQEHTFFSSSETVKIFKDAGVENVSYCPLGFDKDFYRTEKKYLGKDIVHFGLAGKWEKRKNTERIIKSWLKLFGGKSGYQLTCLVDNPFFKPEIMQQLKSQAMGGKHWSNINFLPRLKTNSEVNDFHNAIDIDLSGLSNSEGWGLSSFNSACLGNICPVTNCSAHKDWAQGSNIILVEAEGKEPCYDGAFFNKGLPFNQGNFHKVSDEAIEKGMMDAHALFINNPAKFDRADLIEKFSYKNCVDTIIETVYAVN